MDKRVVFAVAGAGKTTHIVSQLDESSRALIVTYTNNNLYNLKKKIADKFGYIPDGIRVVSYFTFVYSFCYRPFLLHQLKTTGILYEPNKDTFARKANDNYYISPSRRLYSNRIALLVQEKQLLDEVRQRLSKYYDLFIVDEVQDISGHDFNLLLEVAKTDIQTLFVGDFYQYTYATSSDGNVNKTLHDDFDKYKERFTKAGLTIDETLLIKSYRCSPTTCEHVSTKLKIAIASHKTDVTEIRELDDAEIDAIMNDDSIIKLFYQDSSKYTVSCRNWGDSKGEDRYVDVCIVLNPTTYAKFCADKLDELNTMTKNKLYVAMTRASGNVYFVSQAKVGSFKK